MFTPSKPDTAALVIASVNRAKKGPRFPHHCAVLDYMYVHRIAVYIRGLESSALHQITVCDGSDTPPKARRVCTTYTVRIACTMCAWHVLLLFRGCLHECVLCTTHCRCLLPLMPRWRRRLVNRTLGSIYDLSTRSSLFPCDFSCCALSIYTSKYIYISRLDYDGGDCCYCSCRKTDDGRDCDHGNFQCIDPAAACVDDDDITVDNVGVCATYAMSNAYCDEENNKPECSEYVVWSWSKKSKHGRFVVAGLLRVTWGAAALMLPKNVERTRTEVPRLSLSSLSARNVPPFKICPCW